MQHRINISKSIVYAEELNYWKTGKSRPEVWIDKVVKLLKEIEANSIDTAIVNSANNYFIIVRFVLEGNNFCINWKALPSKSNNDLAALVQAATMLYHDIKAKCMVIKLKGALQDIF